MIVLWWTVNNGHSCGVCLQIVDSDCQLVVPNEWTAYLRKVNEASPNSLFASQKDFRLFIHLHGICQRQTPYSRWQDRIRRLAYSTLLPHQCSYNLFTSSSHSCPMHITSDLGHPIYSHTLVKRELVFTEYPWSWSRRKRYSHDNKHSF
jgi:hypothetical protein